MPAAKVADFHFEVVQVVRADLVVQIVLADRVDPFGQVVQIDQVVLADRVAANRYLIHRSILAKRFDRC